MLHYGGHGGTVVTHLSPISEVCGSDPRFYVGKLMVAYHLYVLVSSVHKTVHRDITYTVLKATLRLK